MGSWLGWQRVIIKPKSLWSGKQILWSFLAVSTSRVAPDPKSSNPVFGNGEIIFGVVEKKTVGASQGGLVHVARRA